LIVEYSCWKEQLEIVVGTFRVVGAVTVANADAFAHWLEGPPQDEQEIVVVIQELAVPQALFVFQCE
jgi:hypothetical protein